MEAKILFTKKQFDKAFENAIAMLRECEGLEIRSALKQAASDQGIDEGLAMRMFVLLSEEKLGLSDLN